jgi:hypothetical protein
MHSPRRSVELMTTSPGAPNMRKSPTVNTTEDELSLNVNTAGERLESFLRAQPDQVLSPPASMEKIQSFTDIS